MYIISFLLIMSQILAPGKTFPWALLPWGLGRGIWLLFSLLLLFPIINLAFPRPQLSALLNSAEAKVMSLLRSRGWLIILVLLNAAFQLLNYLHFRHLGYQVPIGSLFVCALALPWIRHDRSFLICTLSLSLLFFSILQNPLTGFRSDMLLVIQDGLDLFSRGKSPYVPRMFEWGLSGMPYFPGTLLSHLPAWLLGVDLRWNLLLYRSIWIGLLFWQVQKLQPRNLELTSHLASQTLSPDLRFQTLSTQPQSVHLIHFFLLNPYFIFRHELYFDFFLLLITVYFVVKQIRFLSIPLLAATWQWSMPLIPFLSVDWVLDKRRDFSKNPTRPKLESRDKDLVPRTSKRILPHTYREAVKNLGLLFLGFTFFSGVIYSTFHSHTTWIAFRNTALLVGNFLGPENTYSKDFGLNFGPLLWSLALSKYSQHIQGATCVGLFLLYLRLKLKRIERFREYTICTLLFFVLFGSHFWQYFWIFPILWLIFCILDAENEPSNRTKRSTF